MTGLLARNIVLLTLIEGLSVKSNPSELNEKMKAIWNIFYHFYIPGSDLSLLQDHARGLWNASESITTWGSSPYNKFIHFLSETTLTRVRKYWLQYTGTNSSPSTQNSIEQRTRAAISETFQKKVGRSGVKILQGIRSAGAHFTNAIETMSSAFEGYWMSGVTGGNKEDKISLGKNFKGCINPMFMISSAPNSEFAVHYGSDPLLGFHLAEAFDSKKFGSSLVDCVVKTAKSQFRSWCHCFLKTASEGRVKIIFHCGDAISLCHKLQDQNASKVNLSKSPPIFIGPWTSAPLSLDGSNCGLNTMFDVIDTSNLADHVGVLNVLPAVVPLLSRKASSVFYVESLLQVSEDLSQSLRTMLCSDVSTMSLILGLSPTGHLLGVTTDAVDPLRLSIPQQFPGRQRQDRFRTTWKVPELGDMRAFEERKRHPEINYRVAFDAEQLGDYFFSIYLKMFAYENWGAAMSSMSLTSVRRQITLPLSGDLRYYTRLSLVSLLRLAKSNIVTDWAKCMNRFLEMVQNDRTLPIGQNSLQELILNLHMYGVREDESLKQSPLDLEIASTISTRSRSLLKVLFNGRGPPPPVIHVALVVPRNRLRIFTAESPDLIGTPGLHLSINHPVTNAENSFFAINCFFGNLRPHLGDSGLCKVEEDDLGWSGSADLIATCAVPAYTLLLGEADDVRVSLVVNTNPSTVQFTLKLGLRNVVYECGIKDDKRLWLLRESPGVTESYHGQPSLEKKVWPKALKNDQACFVELNQKFEVKSLMFHAEIPKDSDESKFLADGASVYVTQTSPCTMTLQVGTAKAQRLVYPFPLNGAAAKIRIARKSLWIEVHVPIAAAFSAGGYDPFPIVIDESCSYFWGMSRVNVQQQSIIEVSGDFDWLEEHIGLTLSASERVFQDRGSPNPPLNGLLSLKESLHVLFESFVGRNGVNRYKPVKIFRLTLNDQCDTIIFSNAMCHDRNTNSILIDAYIVYMSSSSLPNMIPALRNVKKEDLLSIKLTKEESVLWKQLMPGLVERCRHSWTHSPSCEYRVSNLIPLSTAYGESPLCSCGQGKELRGYINDVKYQELAKCATRIAIPLIFAVPYVEKIISETPSSHVDDTLAVEKPMGFQGRSNTNFGATARKCDYCGAEKQDLKLCSRCRSVSYCNHTCQKMAWKTHKKTCNK